jgi:hypothetical protein
MSGTKNPMRISETERPRDRERRIHGGMAAMARHAVVLSLACYRFSASNKRIEVVD